MSNDDEIVREENDKHYHDKVYHLALSPNSHYMATFKSDTLEFKVIETKDSQKLNTVPYNKIDPKIFKKWTTHQKIITSQPVSPQSPNFNESGGNNGDTNFIFSEPDEIDDSLHDYDNDYDNVTDRPHTELLEWSISISNHFRQDNKPKLYLAISCIMFGDMIKHKDKKDGCNDNEGYKEQAFYEIEAVEASNDDDDESNDESFPDKKNGLMKKAVKAFKNPLQKLKDIITFNVGSGEDSATNNTPSGESEKNEKNKDGDDNKSSLYYATGIKHKCKTIILTITLDDEGHNNPDNYTINVSNDQTKNFFYLDDIAGILNFLPAGYDIDQRYADSLSIKSSHNSNLSDNKTQASNINDSNLNCNNNDKRNSMKIKSDDDNIAKINNKLSGLTYSELANLLSSSIITPEISSLLNAHKKTTLVLFNSSGIYRIILNTKENKMDEVQTYQYPHNFEEDLVRYYANKPCIGRLSRCIYENYLLFDQYKDRVQTMEVYNLIDMELEQSFQLKDDDDSDDDDIDDDDSDDENNKKKGHLIKNYGMSTYTISTNRQLLAYSRGIGKITIYLMENGLEIASKDFGEDQQIILAELLNDDEQVLILTKAKSDSRPVINIWNLFYDSAGDINNINNNFQNNNNVLKSVRDFRGLFPSKNIERSHLARNSKDILRIYGDGSVVDIANHEDFIKACSINKLDLRKTLEKNKVYTITKKFLEESNWQTSNINHKLYIPNNDYFKSVQLLVDNQEPWIINNQWQRISAFLNKELTLQLLIGSTTVQIWRKNDDDIIILEYIWTINDDDEDDDDEDDDNVDNANDDNFFKKLFNRTSNDKSNDEFNKNYKIRHSILVQELYIGEGTFLLDVAWGPKASQKATIQWPYKDHHVTPIIHACKALEHLNGKRDQLVGYEKQHKFEKMLEFITKIIWRFVDNKPEMWKLIDVRYDLMSNLVKGGANSLIKFILFGKEEIFSKNNHNSNHSSLYGIERRCSHDSKRKLHVPMTEKWKVMSEITGSYNINSVGSNCDSVVRNDKKPIQKNLKKKKKEKTVLELAIEYSNGGERKKSIMVGYFLDYYGNNALEHLGWMVTASKALPHLYKHNLEHYVEDLFYKECFAEKDLDGNYAIDDLITKEEMLKFRRAEFKAFKGNTKLKQTDIVTKFSLKQFTGDVLIKCFGMMTSFTNGASSSTMPPPIVLRVVPFPNFTLNSLPTQKLQEVIDDIKDFKMPNFLVFLKNVFKHIFVPRGYQVGRKKLDVLSPFAQVIKLDEDIFIFDNPAMEAIIDFRWNPARLHFLHSFILFSLYALSYGILCYAFITKLNVGSGLGILLITLVVYFYYAAYYLFFIEVKQMKHYGWRNYLFDIYNIFDLVTLFSPVFVMSLCLKTTFDFETGFIGDSNDPTLVTWMSFTILFMWCEFILYLRLFDAPCVYIYIVINILKTVWPFLLFMVVIIVAFSHTMFILLQNPDSIGYTANVDSYSAFNPITDDQIPNLAFRTNFDPNSTSDNPFSNFFTAIEATYFWINGDWSQRDYWNTWAIKALSMIGSIMLVSVMQNMFIAFMSGVFEEAASKGRYACLRFKADMIADYEALEHKKFYFWPAPNEPKYIYYVGHSDNLDEWKERSKDRRGCIFKRYEGRNDFLQYKFDDGDLSTDENSLWYFKKKRSGSGSISNSNRNSGIISNRNSGIVSNNNIIIGGSNFDGNNNSFKSKSRMMKTPLRFQNNYNKSIIRSDADFNNTSIDNKDENRINKQLQENNELIKNLNTKITSFDSEVAALKDLVKTLISELKDAKSNNGDRKDGDEGEDDDETKKE